jgi:hypothetical protein
VPAGNTCLALMPLALCLSALLMVLSSLLFILAAAFVRMFLAILPLRSQEGNPLSFQVCPDQGFMAPLKNLNHELLEIELIVV